MSTETFSNSNLDFLPFEWSASKLGEIAKISSGGTPSRSEPKYWNGTIPWVKTGEVNYAVITGTQEKITSLGLENSAARLYPKGTLLLAMYGQGVTRGRVGILGIEATANQACAAIVPHEQNMSEFLFFYLTHIYEQLRELGHGANQRNLNADIVANVPCYIPPIEERCKIAAVLWKVQRAVEVEEKLVATTRELKQSTMRQLFTHGLRGDEQKATPYGDVPQSWQIKALSEWAIVQGGATKGRIISPEEAIEVPYLRVANVQDGHLDLAEMKTIRIRQDELDGYLLQKDDVVLTEGGDFDKLGRGFIWDGQIERCVHQNHVFAVRVNRNHLWPRYFAYLAQSPYGKAYFLTVAHKTTNLACINTTKLRAFPVLRPDLNEQKEIAAILQTIDRKISVHERKRAALSDLFQTLLHQLMTAQIRVDKLDIDTREVAA